LINCVFFDLLAFAASFPIKDLFTISVYFPWSLHKHVTVYLYVLRDISYQSVTDLLAWLLYFTRTLCCFAHVVGYLFDTDKYQVTKHGCRFQNVLFMILWLCMNMNTIVFLFFTYRIYRRNLNNAWITFGMANEVRRKADKTVIYCCLIREELFVINVHNRHDWFWEFGSL
jgi:hypothetical protein